MDPKTFTTVNASPVGTTIPDQGTFTYDLTIDVSSAPSGVTAFAFRPHTTGVQLFPGSAALVDVEFHCVPPTTASVPTLNEWGMIFFTLLIAGMAIVVLKKRKGMTA